MIIKVNYTVSDVYMSTSISPVYIKVVYSGTSTGGGGTWGTITGTLSNQTDLQAALDAKFDDPTGTTAQYLRGDGTLATFPTIPSITGLVPYTGATGAVNLGAFDLTVNSLTVGRGAASFVNNTVLGSQAGAAFTTAQTNVAIGEQALKVHSTGNANTAVGRYAMFSDVDGASNTALGASALVFLASGGNTGNTAIGVNGLGRLTTGSYNTWLGYTSAPGGILTSGSYNTIIGGQVNVGVATLNNNIILADGQGNIRFRDDASSTILSRLQGTGTRMVVSDANGALSTQAIPSVSGFVPYTGGTSDLNLGSYNLIANNVFTGFTSITASATQLVLTVTSAPEIVVTGSGGQTIKLPDATTLQNGATYRFNNNQSSGAILVNNNSNTLVASVPSGAYVDITLLSNSIAAGSWDRHDLAPANVSWSTNTFDYAGSITSATWNGNAVAVNRGGTGATTAGAALTNLGAQAALTLTTTGTSGAATLVGATLNIPQYSGGGGMAIGGAITSATAGSVLFAGASGVLAQDNANLFWDDTNNRLGIGTATPTTRLDVRANVNGVEGFTIGNSNTGTGAATTFQFGQTPTSAPYNAMFVTNYGSGWTGGGGAANSNRLTSGSGSTGGFDIVVDGLNASFRLFTRASDPATPKLQLFATGNLVLQNGGTFADAGYRLDVNGTARVSGNFTAGAFNGLTYVDSTNIFTISGSSSPEVKLWSSSNTGYVSFNFYNSANSIIGGIGYGNSGVASPYTNKFYISNSNSVPFSIIMNFTESARFFNSGNLLLQNGGTFTDAGYKLDVNGTARVVSKLSLGAGTTSNAQINLASSTAPTSPNNGDIWFDGTDLKMRIGGVTKTFTLI
jgi:hypothetical protein